ncbi:MAG: response regulator [Rhodospirillaceae bacterium]
MPHKTHTSQKLRKSILVVDDDESFVIGLTRRLIRHIGVIPACSVEEALKLLQTNSNIGAVATDLKMPGRDGIELLKYVQERFPKKPRILFSGHIDFVDMMRSIDSVELTALLLKPFDPSLILQYVLGTRPAQTSVIADAIWNL